MMIFLLEECNFSCSHCVREDEPMYPGYMLSFEQLQMCLSDCQKLQNIEWVHFSGGEPTLWREGGGDVVDLLLEIANAGFDPGLTSNGSYFNNFVKCLEFFQKYVNGTDGRLRLFLSIDTFHENFDAKRGRSECLDNVLRCKRDLGSEKGRAIDVTVIAIISKDPASLLPDEMIEHYRSQDVRFNFVPLRKAGRARSFAHLCPDLGSGRSEDLGVYYRYYKNKDVKEKKSHLILIGNDYYVFDEGLDSEYERCWHKVGELGHLSKGIFDAF